MDDRLLIYMKMKAETMRRKLKEKRQILFKNLKHIFFLVLRSQFYLMMKPPASCLMDCF